MLLVFLNAWAMNLEFGPETRNLNPRGVRKRQGGRRVAKGEWVGCLKLILSHTLGVGPPACLTLDYSDLTGSTLFVTERHWESKKEQFTEPQEYRKKLKLWREIHVTGHAYSEWFINICPFVFCNFYQPEYLYFLDNVLFTRISQIHGCWHTIKKTFIWHQTPTCRFASLWEPQSIFSCYLRLTVFQSHSCCGIKWTLWLYDS